MGYCLPPDAAQKFRKAIQDGKVDPVKLSKMDNAGLTKFLEGIVGRQDAGELAPHLHDFISKKLETNITPGEAQKITSLSSKAQTAKDILSQDPFNKQKQIDFGNKQIELRNYVESLKPKGKVWTTTNIANIPRSLLTFTHFSAPFTQGVMMIASKAFWKGIPDMFRYFASEKNFNELNAAIIGHPYYPLAQSGKLGITKLGDKLNLREEQIQSSILEHIPVIKIPAKAFNRGFTGYLNGLRFSKFVDFVNAAKLRGEDVGVGSKVLEDGANFINTFTGRGKLYGFENAQAVSNIIFSPRKTTAAFELLNPSRYLNPNISPTARRMAMKQITGDIIVLGSILGLAGMAGASVNLDPTSTDFLDIKIGKTKFNPVGSITLLTRLFARIIENHEVTSSGHKIELGQGFKPMTAGGLIEQYIISKLSPTAGVFADVLFRTKDSKGVTNDPYGNPLTVGNEAYGKLTPITMQNFINMAMYDPQNTAGWIGTFASILGVEESTTKK